MPVQFVIARAGALPARSCPASAPGLLRSLRSLKRTIARPAVGWIERSETQHLTLSAFSRANLRNLRNLWIVLFIFTLSACAPRATPAPATLTVLAAASLTESFTELGKTFEVHNPGVSVAFNFAGSQQLAGQLAHGAPADVFASASQKSMDAAVASSRVAAGSAAVFAANRLVVIFPAANPAGIKVLQDLASPGLKLDLADASVPAGQYALDFLDRAAKDDAYGAAFKDAVLANVVSYETDVRAVVSKVALGEADAGIVYLSDYHAAAADLGRIAIPDALNTLAAYPIAPILDSPHPGLAAAFVALVLSSEGQAVMANYGFSPAP